MKSTIFKICLLSWLLLSASTLLAAVLSGSVRADAKPLAGVVVSDGVSVVRTGEDGRFTLDAAVDAPFVWVATPSGYVARYADGTPRFYLPVDGRASYDFSLEQMPEPFTLIALGDPQPKTEEHMQRLKREVLPDLTQTVKAIRRAGGAPAMLMLGDVVWDSPELAMPVRKLFAGMKIPVYAVIGNHDHLMAETTDFGSERNFREAFGPNYYAFNMGDTHFIVLDNIIYEGSKKYRESIDERQLVWLEKYVKTLPAGARVCVAMHAPFQKYWRDFIRMGNGDRLLALLDGFEVHFITGHTHINSNFEITPTAMEHNVAQVAGNLWRAPLNTDGTPRGYALFNESTKGLAWRYKTLQKPLSYQMELYAPGRSEEHPAEVVAKIWNWDSAWTVEYFEDGRPMGAMKRFETMVDPAYSDFFKAYLADAKEPVSKRLKGVLSPRRAFFYFGAEPSEKTRSVEVVATDRFGRRYTQTLNLKK